MDDRKPTRLCVTASCKIQLELFFTQPWAPEAQIGDITHQARKQARELLEQLIARTRLDGASVHAVHPIEETDIVIRVQADAL